MVTESRLARRRRERAARRQVVRDAGGIGLAVGAYGLSFGALTTASGFSPAETQALSLFMYSGASQFAFVGAVAAGGSLLSASLAAGFLGVRNLFYGVRLRPLLRLRWQELALTGHFVSDESASMAYGHPENPRHAFWSTGLAVFLFWNIGTFAGAVVGSVLPDPQQLGLDAASSAAFLALLAPRLRERFGVHVFVLAVLIAVGAATMLPSGFPVLLAASAALLGALATPKPDSPPSVLAQPRPPTAAAARVPKPAPPPYPMPYQTPTASSYPVSATPPASAPARWESPV